MQSLLLCKWTWLSFVALLKAPPSTETHFYNSLFLVDVQQSMYVCYWWPTCCCPYVTSST